ncbi:protein ycf2 [Phtheirospermum japonicum]|uniref:Protein ycf2 n=1 Tax=Phtheirospermum japonicum TaxID=374723 RepID=A0A830CDK1_9LAMI|nr:protein ycf2 [Phtheirospermum japonicum]
MGQTGSFLKSHFLINDHYESDSIEFDQSFFLSLRRRTEPRILFLHHQSNHLFDRLSLRKRRNRINLNSGPLFEILVKHWISYLMSAFREKIPIEVEGFFKQQRAGIFIPFSTSSSECRITPRGCGFFSTNWGSPLTTPVGVVYKVHKDLFLLRNKVLIGI